MMKSVLTMMLAVLMIVSASCGGSKKVARQQKKQLQEAYETIREEMPEAKVTLEGNRVKIVVADAVLFAINSAEINQEYVPSMEKMAKALNRFPEMSILITGYTDITGTEAYNRMLSEKRAVSARDILLASGVDKARMHTWGMGIKDPVASNDTPEGRMQNRRVEFVVLFDYPPKGE